MRARPCLFVLFVALLAAVPARGQSRIFVGDPSFSLPDGDPLSASGPSILDAFAEGLQNDGHCAGVTSMSDLRDMARFENLKQLLGASGDADAAEALAGALGADRVAAVSVGRVGTRYVVNARGVGGAGNSTGVTETAASAPGVFAAAKKAGGRLGQAMGCGNPAIPLFFEGTLVYEVTYKKADNQTNEAGTSSLETTSHRRDEIEVRGVRPAIGRADIDEVSHIRVTTAEHLSQCAAPGGYRDLPVSSDQRTEMVAKGSGSTEPSVEIDIDGSELRIVGSVSDSIPRVMQQTDTSAGVTCGKPFGPDTTTSSSEAVSTSVDGINFEIRVPFDKRQATQAGSKSWPVELNDMRGTATLTWKLAGRL